MTKRIVVAVLSVIVVPPVIGQSLPNDRPPVTFGTMRPAPGEPYRKLFVPPPLMAGPASQREPLPQVTSARERSPAKRKIVCGMTVVEGDASIDPKMAK